MKPGKIHFFEVDNENKQGIPQLKEAICQLADILEKFACPESSNPHLDEVPDHRPKSTTTFASGGAEPF